MRIIITVVLLFGGSLLANAQGLPAGMQEAIECMNKIDQSALTQMSKKGEAFGVKIKALCDKGDEKAAKAMGLDYFKEVNKNEAFVQLNKCNDLMRKAMPEMDLPTMPSEEDFENDKGSICDDWDHDSSK